MEVEASHQLASPAPPAKMSIDDESLREDSKVVKKRVREEDESVVRRKTCEPRVSSAVDEVELAEPDSSEVRLLQLVDNDGGLVSGAGEKAANLATRLRGKTRIAVFLVVLGRSMPDALSQFVEFGGLRSLGKWLVEDEDDELVSMVLGSLGPLPVTKRAIRSSGIGKIVKKMKEDSTKHSEVCAKVMDDWVKAVGDEKVEETKPSVVVVSKKAHVPSSSDPLASALTKTSSSSTRFERAEARRSGRGGGVQQIGSDEDDDDAPPPVAPVVPQSRPFNKALGDLLERARLREEEPRKKVRWADENSKQLVERREPVPGWLDSGLDDSSENMSLRERTRREHEAEKRALEEAKREAVVERENEARRRIEALRAMKKTRPWSRPQALSGLPRPEDFSLDSPEATRKQPKRIERLIEARYLHPRDIPKSPNEQDPDLLAGLASFDLAVVIPLDEETAKSLSAAAVATPPPAPAPPPPPSQPAHVVVGTDYSSMSSYDAAYAPNPEELSKRLLLLSSDDLEKIMTDPYVITLFLCCIIFSRRTLTKPDGSFRNARLVLDAIDQVIVRSLYNHS